ncbi:hypothetical protein BaRGS_00009439, partial [Batillaria attramentaria]
MIKLNEAAPVARPQPGTAHGKRANRWPLTPGLKHPEFPTKKAPQIAPLPACSDRRCFKSRSKRAACVPSISYPGICSYSVSLEP